MKHIVLFGAGKSATVLINYLKDLATEKQWQVTVADSNYEAVHQKVGNHPLVKAVAVNIEIELERKALVEQANVVISLMPPTLHYLLALDCIEFSKHLLTASYIDDKIKALRKDIEQQGILFLCEMGLDPGIDHMSAMQIIHRIKAIGGTITSFKSHCGGLVAPESDDNPWHYKISWNPKNIVSAGKSGAVFKEDGKEKNVQYEHLFTGENNVSISENLLLSYYPNRDSLSYMQLYQLQEADTFIRTTLRHPDFCFGWKNIIDLKLTDETIIYDTTGMTFADFFRVHFEKHGFSDWLNDMLHTRLSFAKDIMENLLQIIETEGEIKGEEKAENSIMLVNEKGELDTIQVDDVKDKAASSLALKMHEASLSLKQLFFLGMDSDEKLNLGKCSAADVLQFILQSKLALQPDDKDMVIMLHEIEYELNGIHNVLKSTLILKGEDHIHTAMAKTVGLPLGIAAKLILEGEITETGLHLPIRAAIYNPVLSELESNGIWFNETIE